MRRLNLPGLILIIALVAQLPVSIHAQRRSNATAASSATHNGADQITPDQLKNYLYFIAADAMQGRDTPSPGLDVTANFIAMNLARWGFKPAGDDGTFLQKIALLRNYIDPAKTSAEMSGAKFTYGEDFQAVANAGTASGNLVYVGNGWVIKSKGINSYEGIDVRGKIVILFGTALPKGVTRVDLTGQRGEDWESPLVYARTHGARGAILIPTLQTFSVWNATRRAATERGSLEVERVLQQEPQQLPVITASAGMLTALFRGERIGADEIFSRRASGDAGASFDLASTKQMTFTVGTRQERERTQNVVGIWEGSDPVLRNEYVALGAHYDHVGTGLPLPGSGRFLPPSADTSDLIWNGADDDGSGTTALLAMAETLAHNPRPRRSILFVWHCGEEKGLIGSDYFTRFPTVPLKQVVTQLNIDMIGRSKRAGDTNPLNAELSGPNEIYVVGSHMMSTELGDLSEAVNRSYLNLSFNYKYDDPADPNRFFFRSDHFNYAKNGIPVIFYFDGEHEDYHRPGDEPQKIDYEKMTRVTRTVYMMMWELANRPTRPLVDRQLPPERMVRGF
ncbi:MAG TPA: M28 family peptidase [Pyrinomonadaceae bacterium]|nr:M28 family peptidase [Pyrinomonadaceae bacterium]